MILDYLVTKTTTTINHKWKEQKNKKKEQVPFTPCFKQWN